MANDITDDLLLAERGGRLITARGLPEPGQTWRMSIGEGRVAAALAAAARWADRYGAKVWIDFGDDAAKDPVVRVLADVCSRMGMTNAPAQSKKLEPNHLEIVGKGFIRLLESVPDDSNAWNISLNDDKARWFVRLANGDDRVLSRAESREVDRKSIDDYGLPGYCLMENAGCGAVMVAKDMLEKTRREGSILVAAGGGNNAGDGFVVARGLAALGYKSTVALLKNPATLTGDAAVNFSLLNRNDGIEVVDVSHNSGAIENLLKDRVLVVDALLGTGFKGEVSEALRAAIRALNCSGIQILALDLPSGLNGDSGEADPETIRAARTVTFANLKKGLLLGAGPEKCGLVYVAEIGAPRGALGA